MSDSNAEKSPIYKLDPRGKIHIPIGIPNTLDTLKTFVEAEGNFSPGFGTYGIYFWLYDYETKTLAASTMDHIHCKRGLHEDGYLIPFVSWKYRDVEVKIEICEVMRTLLEGDTFIVGANVYIINKSKKNYNVSLFVVVRPLGAAGGQIYDVGKSLDERDLVVENLKAVIPEVKPDIIRVSSEDEVCKLALEGKVPDSWSASSKRGDCSGIMRYNLNLESEAINRFGFVCPVLPFKYAVRHKWVDLGQDALADMAELDSEKGGIKQPDVSWKYYRKIKVSELFDEAISYWKNLLGHIKINLPDYRWGQGMIAMLSHATLCMNENAPDVAVINYNVFNRDGMYSANMMQKSGLFDLAEKSLDYFISHPFNGRAFPEADNPGQILWSLGQQWLFTRDKDWLNRVYPSIQKICAMIEYYRTKPEPHWVDMGSLGFGESLSSDKRKELKSGSCDGYHPEYTEAFDIAGLRLSAILADAIGNNDDAINWENLADRLFQIYDEKFGDNLGREYGSFSVLWPCRLYSLYSGKAYEQFKNIGAKKTHSWRYFPLATTHQGLLAGNREAGYGTVNLHLDEKQMQDWYAFDEGGGSSSGGWHRANTNWKRSVEKPGANLSVAMPHGWAIAELWLLMRDCLLFEDDSDRIVLLSGISPEWFGQSMEVIGLKTHFGTCSFIWAPRKNGAILKLLGDANPPNGFVLYLPEDFSIVVIDGEEAEEKQTGFCLLPANAKEICIGNIKLTKGLL